MTPGTRVPPTEINEFVETYEAACMARGCADLAEFLPEITHPFYSEVLLELVRVDLEYAWSGGRPVRLQEYRRRFPALFDDPEAVQEVAYEEYRLRLLAGQRPNPEEYRRQYGVRTDGWPAPAEDPEGLSERTLARECANLAGLSCQANGHSSAEEAAQDHQRFRLSHLGEALPNSAALSTSGVRLDVADLIQEIRQPDPDAIRRFTEVASGMPEAGSDFLGFRLVEELGRGAFGRVFLAQQGSLANRTVALKVGTELFREGQNLAQLQHTNIVPIYSAHQAGPFQAVCMPYFGRTTLADVFGGLKNQPSLPASGRHFVSTLQGRKSTVQANPISGSRSQGSGVKGQEPGGNLTATSSPTPEPRPLAPEGTTTLKNLERLSYVGAVIWIGARLADGLAHAHERGIFHRDLKPANILLTDEGQPMLLDFNLAEDAKLRGTAAAARIGGTLSYMAPEQLESFRGSGHVDGRSDLYSLGVVLFELLTGRHPFDALVGPLHEMLPRLIEQRRQPPPRLRCWNRAVSPAVEAVIRRCLEPDPDRRYPSARALQEDLDGHLAHLPLRHTREPSVWERMRKWARRHPRLLSGTTVAVVAVMLLLALGVALIGVHQSHLDAEAASVLREFRLEKAEADFCLNRREPDQPLQEGYQPLLREGVRRGRNALDRYQILDNPRWQEQATVRRLSASEREQLREELVDLLWGLSRATLLQSAGLPEDRRREQLLLALEINKRAEDCLDRPSAALCLQRAQLLELLGRQDEARLARAKGADLNLGVSRDYFQAARDRYRTARGLWDGGETGKARDLLRESIDLLSQATRQTPQNFWAWYLQGSCHDLLQQNSESLVCYSVCTALRPDDYACYFNRGLAYARQRKWVEARRDFDRACTLRPDLPETYIQRAMAARAREDYAAAEQDLARALELGSKETRVYFLRAAVREKTGDREGARSDREEGLRREPVDEASWVERGIARLPGDPKKALADFEQALRVNPRYLPAWQDKAHVLSDYLKQDEEALKAVHQAVVLYPDFVPARLGRGVLLARAGKREQAHRDAREALSRDASPPTLYQAANIFALTSRGSHPEDCREALPLLSRALAGGFGLDVLDKDSDMDPIRDNPEFRRIVKAARELRETSGQKAP